MLTRTDNIYTISIPEYLDAKIHDDFYSHLDGIEASGLREIVIDCSNITKVSGRSIVIIWQLYDKLREAGIKVCLESVNENLEQILKSHVSLGSLDKQKEVDGTDKNKSRIICHKSEKMLELSFKPGSDDIAFTTGILKDFLQSRNVLELDVFELITVFYEVATNIRLHANLNTNSCIDFTVLVSRDSIFMRIEDRGIAFDPTRMLKSFSPSDFMKSRKKRGLGIALVSRLIDSMSYMRSTDGTNVLCLRKSITRGGK